MDGWDISNSVIIAASQQKARIRIQSQLSNTGTLIEDAEIAAVVLSGVINLCTKHQPLGHYFKNVALFPGLPFKGDNSTSYCCCEVNSRVYNL